MLTIGSVFAGIGGIERGLELLGLGPVVWQAEANPYRRAVLAKHWPRARRYERVEEVGDEAPWVNILCGGFPCQDVSQMGKRAGLRGQRSGLWREYVRAIRVLRPDLVFVENVPELVAELGEVLGPLAQLGLDAEWGVYSAEEAGAPHLRRRIFILAWPLADTDGNGCEGRGRTWTRAALSAAARGGAMADAHSTGRPIGADAENHERTGPRAPRCPCWPAEPDVGRVAHGVSSRLDSRRRRHRLAALGDAVVPAQSALAFLDLAQRAGMLS